MRTLTSILVVAACGGVDSPPQLAGTAPTDEALRWVYRIHAKGIESPGESVATFVIDEGAGTVVSTSRSRGGKSRGTTWIDNAPSRWRLVVSHGRELRLSLTGSDGIETAYACKLQDMEVAPATALRASDGGESGWKMGHWTVPTRRVAVHVCLPVAYSRTSPSELMLAPEPIEHVIADDTCCQESPSLRFVPADGSVVPPRDSSFPEPDY